MSAPPASFLDRLSVAPAADGLVAVTVLLPPDLVRDYCHFLESLAAFFESADRRIKIERAHLSAATQAAQKESGQRYRADYRARLCASFDSYLVAGLDRKDAFKRVAADLRAVNHPWSAFELVRSELIAAGRGVGAGRPRRVQS